MPWPEIAFASVEFCLRRYFADRAAGRNELHYHTIDVNGTRRRCGTMRRSEIGRAAGIAA